MVYTYLYFSFMLFKKPQCLLMLSLTYILPAYTVCISQNKQSTHTFSLNRRRTALRYIRLGIVYLDSHQQGIVSIRKIVCRFVVIIISVRSSTLRHSIIRKCNDQHGLISIHLKENNPKIEAGRCFATRLDRNAWGVGVDRVPNVVYINTLESWPSTLWWATIGIGMEN